MTQTQAALVWCPLPDTDTARRIAAQLLEEKRIACANILPAAHSMYVWNGAVSSSEEVAVLLKTTAEQLDAVIARLGELHPYDTPAIMGWCCDAAHPLTLEWLAGAIGEDPA